MSLVACECPPGPGQEPEPCSRAQSQTRMYLEQIRNRVALGAPDMTKRDYLVDAATQIRLALERDVSEDYEAAFNHYQNGVDVLLRGMHVDPNKERCEAVKLKITKYLRRAEEIFNCHLQRTLGSGASPGTGFSSLRLRPIRTLSSALEQLRGCRVVGVIEKVSKQSLQCGRRWCVRLGVTGGQRQQLPPVFRRQGSPSLPTPPHTSQVLERKPGAREADSDFPRPSSSDTENCSLTDLRQKPQEKLCPGHVASTHCLPLLTGPHPTPTLHPGLQPRVSPPSTAKKFLGQEDARHLPAVS
uniref:Ribosomal protein S6 kinase like 1 n=1 Tax=Molossus molossus TaxID=27622 RepID=A0A7J8K0Y4_MOLMO|nr:ribosomal protein S6 kinase like 1 [Molossus molossus]